MTLRFTVLGPVGVTVGARPAEIHRPRRLGILAYLLLHANQVVTVDRLIAATWGDAPPTTARAQVQSDIHGLRRAIRAAGSSDNPISTQPGGYRLELRPEQLDLALFTDQAALARAEAARGEAETAAGLMRSALSLWRGPALSGASGDFLEPAQARLEEARLDQYEWLVDLELALGRHHRLVTELTEYLTEHPLRERLRIQLMLALYRSGRQPDALRVGRRGREILVDEYGLDPGPALTELETAILRQDPALNAPGGSPAEPAATTVGDRPAVSTSCRPAQLPPFPVPFAGRADDVVHLGAHLHAEEGPESRPAPPVLLLHGMAGVGKTALAVRIAHTVRADYPDGHLYLDLRSGGSEARAPRHVVAEALRGLGVDHRELPYSLDERAALYRSRLADRRLLVVVDDAGSVDQVQPLVPAAPGCAVLVTSRFLLDLPSARRHRVDPLPECAGLDVLTAHLDDRRSEVAPAAARAVVRACGGQPLALRIAAARVRSGTRLTDLAELLADPRHLLDELAVDGLSVREGLAAVHRSLSPSATRVLAAAAQLPTPSVPDWVPVACAGLGAREAVRVLDELVRCHLLTLAPGSAPGPNRYLVHRLVAAFVAAGEGGDPPGDDPVARAAHTWGVLAGEAVRRITASPHPAEPTPPPDVDLHNRTLADPAGWLRKERANLIAVQALAQDRDWPELADRIAAALADRHSHVRACPPVPAAVGQSRSSW
ncbi:BTAD domain-containing putative transcriptional regulator [Micromonospora chalcea]